MSKSVIVRQLAFVSRGICKLAKLHIPSLKSFSVEKLVLCPADVGVFPPPVTLKGQIDRVTATFSGRLEDAIKYATMTSCSHGATVAHRIEDVVIDNGYLYKGLHAEHVSSLGRPSSKPIRQMDAMCLCSTPSGSRFFGDWLLSDNLLELLAIEAGIPPLKIHPHAVYPHLTELNKLLALRESFDQNVIYIKNLYLVDDVGYNKSKRARLELLRSNIRRNIQGSNDAGQRVYITRGAAYKSTRDLVNEEDIIRYLSSKGFLILDPTQKTAREILENILDCSVVAGVEGSQLSYGFLALKQGGLMMTLQPPYRFQPSFRPRCASVGINWGFLVGHEVDGGFTIDINELDAVLKPYLL